MEVQNVVKSDLFLGIIVVQQRLHLLVDFLGLCGFFLAYGICHTFVVAHGRPRLLAVGGVGLQYEVQLFDVWFGDLVRGMVDDIIDTTEMVDGFHDVVDARVLRPKNQYFCKNRTKFMPTKSLLFPVFCM